MTDIDDHSDWKPPGWRRKGFRYFDYRRSVETVWCKRCERDHEPEIHYDRSGKPTRAVYPDRCWDCNAPLFGNPRPRRLCARAGCRKRIEKRSRSRFCAEHRPPPRSLRRPRQSHCRWCGRFLHLPKTGRPPMFCGSTHRQRWHRRRLSTSERAIDEDTCPLCSGEGGSPCEGCGAWAMIQDGARGITYDLPCCRACGHIGNVTKRNRCLRCGRPLPGRQTQWCSDTCRKKTTRAKQRTL